MKKIFYFLMVVCLLSCGEETSKNVQLKKAGKELTLELDERTKSCSRALFLYEDPSGKEYVTFQNDFKNEICFYDFKTQKLEFKVTPAREGNNGVGDMLGYYIHDLDHIYLTSRYRPEVSVVDKAGILKEKYSYRKAVDGVPLRNGYSCSMFSGPIVEIGDQIYVTSSCDRRVEVNPVSVVIDKNTKEVRYLPFFYPTLPIEINKYKAASFEEHRNHIYDGKQFVYSFFYEEDLYIASVDHQTITRKKAKSQYIEKVDYLDDFGNVTSQELCEHRIYGLILYDKYRQVYYRVAHPKSELNIKLKDREYIDLQEYGRKNFSIIIMDKDFNVIGETMFPDYTYNSNMMFVHKNGLYISASHAFNENYSDDILQFHCFELVKE